MSRRKIEDDKIDFVYKWCLPKLTTSHNKSTNSITPFSSPAITTGISILQDLWKLSATLETPDDNAGPTYHLVTPLSKSQSLKLELLLEKTRYNFIADCYFQLCLCEKSVSSGLPQLCYTSFSPLPLGPGSIAKEFTINFNDCQKHEDCFGGFIYIFVVIHISQSEWDRILIEEVENPSPYQPPSIFKIDKNSPNVVLKIQKFSYDVNKELLATFSEFFRYLFGNLPMKNLEEYELFGINPEAFQEILSFMYQSTMPKLDKLNLEIFKIASLYQIKKIQDICEESIIKNNINIDNWLQYYAFSDFFNADKLHNYVIEFVVNNWQLIRCDDGKYRVEMIVYFEDKQQLLNKFYDSIIARSIAFKKQLMLTRNK